MLFLYIIIIYSNIVSIITSIEVCIHNLVILYNMLSIIVVPLLYKYPTHIVDKSICVCIYKLLTNNTSIAIMYVHNMLTTDMYINSSKILIITTQCGLFLCNIGRWLSGR